MAPFTPHPGEREDRRPELLAAANRVFAEKGYVSASLEEVAGHLGILEGSLYHYVRSKEELLYAIMSETYGTAVDVVRRHETSQNAGSKVISFVRIWMSHVQSLKYSAVFADRHDYIPFLAENHQSEIRQITRDLNKYLESLINEDILDGRLKVQWPSRITARGIFTLMNTTGEWMHSDGQEEWDDVTEWYIHFLHNGFRSENSSEISADGKLIAASAAKGLDSAAVGIVFARDNVRRRSERRGERWNELVDAAEKAFAEKTYPGASLAEIARRMDVRKASLYHYINAKEELLFELQLRVNERALGMITAESAREPAPGEQELASLIAAWASQTAKFDTAYFPLGTPDLEYLAAEHSDQIRSIHEIVCQYIEGIISNGVEEGRFWSSLNINYAVNSLLVALNRSPRWFRRGKGEPSLGEWNIQLFLNGLFKSDPIATVRQ
jgi:AcrR family transcriptional regulator